MSSEISKKSAFVKFFLNRFVVRSYGKKGGITEIDIF